MLGSTKQAATQVNENQGLAVTLQELIEQQRYLPYLAYDRRKATSQFSGSAQSAFKGRGMEFEDVRAYTFGDDIRNIDWRITARRGVPYTKIFVEERDREIIAVLDLSSSMVFGTRNELKSVTASKIAALIGWKTLQNQDKFGALIFDGKNTTYIQPKNNKAHLVNIFHKIEQKTHDVLIEQHDNNISLALEMLQHHQKGKGTVFILSDFHNFNENQFEKISILSKKHNVCCVNIFDVLEEIAPRDGVYAAQYNGQKTVFDTGAEGFTTKYQYYFHQHREMLRTNCKKYLCGYIEVRTDVPYYRQMAGI